MDPELDVRTVAPRDRHRLVFAAFDELAPGGALLLINDHDPKALHAQFESTRPGLAKWEQQEGGPERWAIRIEKLGG